MRLDDIDEVAAAEGLYLYLSIHPEDAFFDGTFKH